MTVNSELKIAVMPGDGIGNEIMDACLAVLDKIQRRVGGYRLTYIPLRAGAEFYRQTGTDITDETFDQVRRADAILFGAMGLPDVRFSDGTEIAPHLKMRDEFGLFAGVRPVKSYPNVPRRLADERASQIDFVVLRESTEGLFYSRGRGEVIGDEEARETLRITRATSEKLFDFAFDLARRRKAGGGKGLVTCVDKANVFRAYAFFRKIFDERAKLNPDIVAAHAYVDAQALDLIRRPWEFDVLVMENMFADILSDLGGGLIGGMGMAPCAEIGLEHALFQPAHGSAPDIAGQDKANPTAMFLSAAMMLDWLGNRHGLEPVIRAGRVLQQAVANGFALNRTRPREFGGTHGTKEHARIVLDILDEIAAA
jgi:3-isopropylmalate dehydrogenase